MHLCSLDVWNVKQGWREERLGWSSLRAEATEIAETVRDDRPGRVEMRSQEMQDSGRCVSVLRPRPRECFEAS